MTLFKRFRLSCFVLAFILASCYAAFDAMLDAMPHGCTGEVLDRKVSPDGQWMAITEEQICLITPIMTNVVSSVALLPLHAPDQVTSVIFVDTGGHVDERPVPDWLNGSTLLIKAPLVISGVSVRDVGPIHVQIVDTLPPHAGLKN